MAEDLSDIVQPMDFHPCDTPRGMLYYDMEILTDQQQTRLNTLKTDTIRENQKYLAAHPEIRACVAIISRLVMRQRPRTNIHEIIAEYFSKSRVDIENDVKEYLEKRNKYTFEAVSALNLGRTNVDSISESDSSDIDASQGTLLTFRQMSSHNDSAFWRTGLSDITTPVLPMQQSASLRNVVSDFDKIKSISTSRQDLSESKKDKPMLQKPVYDGTRAVKMATHISEYLKPKKPQKDSSKEDDNISYGGHIPTIEDYDAGYSKRRRTYVSDNQQNFNSEISQIFMEKPSQPAVEEVEVQLEPCQHMSDVDVASTSLSVSRSETSPVGIRDSVEMQSLMEKRAGLSETAMHRLDGDFRDMSNRPARKTSSFSKPSHRKSSSKSYISADDSTKEKPDRTISFHIKKSSSADRPRASATKFSDTSDVDGKESGELKSRLKKTSMN